MLGRSALDDCNKIYLCASCPLQVVALIEEQTKKIDQPIHALLLVGGFSGASVSPLLTHYRSS